MQYMNYSISPTLVFQTLNDFLQQLELMCGTDQLEILLKKPDKKKERQVLLCFFFKHPVSYLPIVLILTSRQDDNKFNLLHADVCGSCPV